MKKIIVLTFFCLVAMQFVFGQDYKHQKSPDEKIIINKEYDENGNIISYDSTYIHQWSSDSTLQFPFDDQFHFGNFGDMNELMKRFFGDSTRMPMNRFHFSPFDDDDFMHDFGSAFNDSIFFRNFLYNSDSSFTFPHRFNRHFPDLDEFFRDFNSNSHPQPRFNTDGQREEWEKLMKKQQKEQEELLKKWGKNRE